MSETNWTETAGNLATGDVDRGVTQGVPPGPPDGGGAFFHGFHALTATAGSVALYANQARFDPMAKGGILEGALIRLAGNDLHSPFLFICLQGTNIAGIGYMLGLLPEDPSKIVLRKGALLDGFPDNIVDPTVNGVFALSANSISDGNWVHLRLAAAVQPNDDVHLTVQQNDLAVNPVTAPVWVPVPGMDDVSPGTGIAFVDDALGINSGTQPLLDGRGGFGFHTDEQGTRSAVDHIRVARQL